jgi:ATP-binding cassette subfamily B (MDR/TAP) protein 1
MTEHRPIKKEKEPVGDSPSDTCGSTGQARDEMTVTIDHKSEGDGDTKEEKKDTSFKYYLVSSEIVPTIL